jgi:hypothetical protein
VFFTRRILFPDERLQRAYQRVREVVTGDMLRLVEDVFFRISERERMEMMSVSLGPQTSHSFVE